MIFLETTDSGRLLNSINWPIHICHFCGFRLILNFNSSSRWRTTALINLRLQVTTCWFNFSSQMYHRKFFIRCSFIMISKFKHIFCFDIKRRRTNIYFWTITHGNDAHMCVSSFENFVARTFGSSFVTRKWMTFIPNRL